MTSGPDAKEFHFLEKRPNETGDEFLKRRLSYMERHFSYEELSGLSVDELNNQIKFYNILLQDTYQNFVNPDFVFADELDAYEAITGEELDLHEALTSDQRMQITSVANKIHRNFDKAREDARDRKYERLSKMMNAIPVINKLKAQS